MTVGIRKMLGSSVSLVSILHVHLGNTCVPLSDHFIMTYYVHCYYRNTIVGYSDADQICYS